MEDENKEQLWCLKRLNIPFVVYQEILSVFMSGSCYEIKNNL